MEKKEKNKIKNLLWKCGSGETWQCGSGETPLEIGL
jgi:diaminopimelate epimerase